MSRASSWTLISLLPSQRLDYTNESTKNVRLKSRLREKLKEISEPLYWRKEGKILFIHDFELQGPELLKRPKVTVLKSKVYTSTHSTGKGKRKFWNRSFLVVVVEPCWPRGRLFGLGKARVPWCVMSCCIWAANRIPCFPFNKISTWLFRKKTKGAWFLDCSIWSTSCMCSAKFWFTNQDKLLLLKTRAQKGWTSLCSLWDLLLGGGWGLQLVLMYLLFTFTLHGWVDVDNFQVPFIFHDLYKASLEVCHLIWWLKHDIIWTSAWCWIFA